MCNNGINITQLEQMIDQVDDHLALEYRWTHNVGHSAGDAGFQTAAKKLHDAQSLLADVRSILDEAKSALADGAEVTADITAKLV